MVLTFESSDRGGSRSEQIGEAGSSSTTMIIPNSANPTSSQAEAPSLGDRDDEPMIRTRYLRACDRCRSRKVKCDTQDPCARCKVKNVPCTFNPPASGTFSVPVKKDKEMQTSGVTGIKRKRSVTATPGPVAGPSQITRDARAKLDAEKVTPENTHWYTSHPGTFRIVGTTSGLPILDSARHLLSIRGNASPPSGSTWDYLNSLMQGKSDHDSTSEAINNEALDAAEVDGTEDGARNLEEAFSIYAEVSAKIPGDLLASLLDLFFRLVHPSWPILHADRFFNDTEQWNDPSHGAMVVAMCMLASRYSSDPRVLSLGGDSSSAGTQWHQLFHKLLGTVHRGTFKDCLALFYISQFYCVNKVPSPLSFHYFAACAAYCIDFGLNREYPAQVPLDSIEREVRRRAGWAIFCYNMQISAIFGRQQWFTLQIWDNIIPKPFSDHSNHSTSLPNLMDPHHVLLFNEMIRISAVLDITLWAVVHRPLFTDSPFLAKIAFKTDPLPQDEEGMRQAEEALLEWREALPPELRQRDLVDRIKSPFFSIASEQIAGVETLIEILLAARRLQLTLATRPLDPEKESALRGPLVQAAKSMITSMIQLGSADLLHQADMLFAYRCLVASRLLLAALLSAKSQRDWQMEAECHRALQATALLLDIFATKFPSSKWAAKTFENTCKVCGVVLTHGTSTQAMSLPNIPSQSGQGIFSTKGDLSTTMTRPNIFNDSPIDAIDLAGSDLFATLSGTNNDYSAVLDSQQTAFASDPLMGHGDLGFSAEGAVPQPDVDISWLFPGIPIWSDST